MQNNPPFVGRATELRALKQLVTAARNGISGAVVVRGDPGIGKTALLEHVTSDLTGITVVRSDGFEAERSLPYAGLHRVGLALGEHVVALPPRLQQALRVAWGSEEGPAPDRYLVGLAILALFAEAGGVRPVVCVLDDVHWLDSESREVLAFTARRLQAESTVVLFSARDDDETDVQLAGVASIRLAGLDARSAVQLLSSTTTATLDPLAATQIADATGGNPLALIDLGRDLSIRQLSQLSLSVDPPPLSRQLEVRYLRQVRDLSSNVQRWLLLAAAETSGHSQLITTAAVRLEISPDCAVDASRAGLVTIGDSIAFRHPLVRSAVYGAPAAADRRQVHAVLAAAARELGLVELEAWHAAEATFGVDAVAAERLETVAERAARRGALVSGARLLARAAELSPAGPIRNNRWLAAAEAAGEAGAAVLSRDLLDRIDPDGLDPIQQGRRIMARTQAAIFIADPAGVMNAPADMLSAAAMFHGHDPKREQRALVQAFEFALVTELLMQGTTVPELGLRIAAGADVADGPYAIVLRAIASHILDPYADAVPHMRTAVAMLAGLGDEELPKFGFVGIALTTALFDDKAGADYLSRLARIAQDAGALRALDTALWVRSLFELARGNAAACGRYVEQVRDLRRAIGYEAENVVNVSYLTWTGVPEGQVELIADVTRTMGFGGVDTAARSALGVREIAEGRYGDAHRRIQRMIEAPFLHVTYLQFADYVEAALRSGHVGDATDIADKLATLAAASPTPWLAGLDRRCRALLADDADAEGHFVDAIEFLSAADVPADLGRAHLLYGEWLRRMKRRRDARTQLRTAVEIFDRIDAPTFGRRARAELAATGEATTPRQVVAGVEMSPREAAVARMAAEGSTNAEISGCLFISTNTVDYHLRKVFQKLGISSRRQLAERFGGTG